MAKKAKGPRGPTKSELFSKISDKTGLTKKDVTAVFTALDEVVAASLKGPAGEVTIPGLVKLLRHHKPARAARQGINPFTKEPMTFKAKPAQKTVKARVLKHAKDMVA